MKIHCELAHFNMNLKKGKHIVLGILLLLMAQLSLGQEQLVGLQINPYIKEASKVNSAFTTDRLASDTIPILLPFLDDFSKSTIFPSSDKWIDDYVYVNSDYCISPVNLGVATFDAINDSGTMYPDATPGPIPFIADHLTSRYIRLDSVFSPVPQALSPADSVFLSFYYQPQGRGSAPNASDSLVLQFLDPSFDSITPSNDTIHIDSRWRNVWATKGLSLDTFYIYHNRYFAQVMVPIRRAYHFNKYFSFRFLNYVSLASSSEPSWQSNCSQWNLDQVYLNTGRSRFDTVYPEIRFIDRPPTLLKNYTSMPFPQFCNDPLREMDDTIQVVVRNRDTINHKIGYKYLVNASNGALIKAYQLAKDSTIRPYPKYNEETLRPPIPFLYPISNEDSATFMLRHYVYDKVPGTLPTDSIQGYDKLYNYYSYDDGTAELGYGTTRTGSRIAYRFKLNKSPDTLRAVSIFFNKTLSNLNQQYFLLTVWNDNNGTPGDSLASRLVLVKFAGQLNKFVTYHLSPPVQITGTFYVGVITTTDDNLNIGFDKYNNSQNNLLFNATGQWYSSSYSGALMMRPIIGKPIPLGIEEPNQPAGALTLYPNPNSSGMVHIKCPECEKDAENCNLRVINLFGQVVKRQPYQPTIELFNIASGFYVVEITNRLTNQRWIGKLLLNQ